MPTPAAALQMAIANLLQPVADLAVARGLPFDAVDELLKMAFVRAAARAHPGLAEHRKVSRISITSGINRREVTRLIQRAAAAAAAGRAPASLLVSRSLAGEVHARWRSERAYLDARGRARVLPRLGPQPSFEALAQGLTRDVHPRGLLDELCRLGLALWDAQADTVAWVPEPLLPKGDPVQRLGVLGNHVGDHLRAAVANVLGGGSAHFEQAVFVDGLTAAAVAAMRPAMAAQWRLLLQALTPALENPVRDAGRLPPPAVGRLRLGLYSYHENGADKEAASGAGAARAKQLRRRVLGPSGPAQEKRKPR